MNPTDWQNISALGILGMIVVGFMVFLAKKLDTVITMLIEMHTDMENIAREQTRISNSLHNFKNKLMDYVKLPKGDENDA